MFICAKLRDIGIEGLKDKINKLKEIEFLQGLETHYDQLQSPFRTAEKFGTI
jgi:hypothetical protein